MEAPARTMMITREDPMVDVNQVVAHFNVLIRENGEDRNLLITGVRAEARRVEVWMPGADPMEETYQANVVWPSIGSVDAETARHFALCVQTAAIWAETEAERLTATAAEGR